MSARRHRAASIHRFPSVAMALVAGVMAATPAAAQTRRVALDVVSASDSVKGSTPRRDVGVWFDVFSAVRVADGLDVIARPVISRRAFDGAWQKQVYQLGMRYEHQPTGKGGVGVRLEGGQLPSPIGAAMLENRADLNPVVSQHSAYYFPLPRVDSEIPRAFLIAGAYPLGAQATVSTRTWDARLAFTDSSPVRGRPFFNANNMPRLLNTVIGGGFTPRIGLRLGVGVARGAYTSVNEVRDRSRGDRDATMVQVEGEWSFGYTRIVGEVVKSTLETARADAVASGGWIEITQTLSPRLFVAGRADSQQFRYHQPATNAPAEQYYKRFEAIAGYRLAPDLTLRGGYMVRKGYVVFHWDDQIIGSIVWQKRIY
jgi:hypothetical protein